MEEELANLKKMLKALVLSSPTRIDARSVLRDYRDLVGEPLPHLKFGYSDPLVFLRERFNDCFLFQGPSSNPELILIVPNVLKHLDNFVQKQRMPSTAKNIHKRTSIPESTVKLRENQTVTTFKPQHTTQASTTATEKITMHRQTTQRDKPQATSKPPQQCEDRHVADNMDSDRLTRLTTSRLRSSKKAALEKLKREVRELVLESPEGLLCTDLMRLYRQRHGRDLEFGCFGFTSVLSLASCVAGVSLTARADCGDWLLSDASAPVPSTSRAAPAPAPAPVPSTARAPVRSICRARNRAAVADESEDALPGIDYAPEVFPEDCLRMLESIPAANVADVRPGDELEVVVSEVYSPSHFWLQRLGVRHNIAMENIMDEMNQYYSRGEGRTRRLLPGAVRVGYCCACRYDGDWHRSVIIKVINEDTVKVRYVDYGTVERVPVSGLRPLRFEWAALDAQALRARLADVRPPRTAGRLWPRTSARHFLELVRDRPLVAPVVAVDAQEDVLEVLLIDTSTSEDCCIGSELVLAEHAEARDDSASGVTSSAEPAAGADSDEDASLLGSPCDSDDAVSDVSASASQLGDGAPHPMPTWACPSDSEEDVETAVTAATAATAGVSFPVLASADLAVSVTSEMLQRRLALYSRTSVGYLLPRFAALESGAEIGTYIRDGIFDCEEGYHVHALGAQPRVASSPPSTSSSATSPPRSTQSPVESVDVHFETPPAAYQRVPLVTSTATREVASFVTSPASRRLALFMTPPAPRKPKPGGTSLVPREQEPLVTQHVAREQAPLATAPTDAPPARCPTADIHSPLVTLSRYQVRLYCLLSRQAPGLANRYMLRTLNRALEEADDPVSATWLTP